MSGARQRLPAVLLLTGMVFVVVSATLWALNNAHERSTGISYDLALLPWGSWGFGTQKFFIEPDCLCGALECKCVEDDYKLGFFCMEEVYSHEPDHR